MADETSSAVSIPLDTGTSEATEDFTRAIAASLFLLFCAFFVIVAVTIGLITAYQLVFWETVPATGQLFSWLEDTAIARPPCFPFSGAHTVR